MRIEDIEQPPCACGECVQAQVTDKPRRRDPRSGRLLHGYELKRWYQAKDACLTSLKAKFPDVATVLDREPGQDG